MSKFSKGDRVVVIQDRSQVLFYRATTEGVIDVVRVLHQRMDIDRHL